MSSISICVKWSGKEYEVSELAATDTVETLKVRQHNKSKWCLFRWRLWKRLVWGRRGKSCWIWRWTIIQNTLSWCSMFRWKERLQLTAWCWGSSASSRTSNSWWWEGDHITWLSNVNRIWFATLVVSLEETIAETQTVPENLPEVLNDFEEEEEVRNQPSTVEHDNLKTFG